MYIYHHKRIKINFTMEDHVNVVLYSKFSASCTKFMEMLTKVPNFKHTTICVDHPDVRKRISTSKKLTIKQVPSIIRLHQKNGYAESFEGERAFSVLNSHYIEYLQEMTKSMSQPQPLMQQPPQSFESLQSFPQSHQNLQIPNAQNAQNVHPQQMPPQQMPQQQMPQQLPQNVQQNDPSGMGGTNMRSMLSTPVSTSGGGGQTSLENLMDLSELGPDAPEKENALNTYHHVPPVSANGNVSISGNIKKDSSATGGNIVSRAMQMQKERENETSTNTKIPSA